MSNMLLRIISVLIPIVVVVSSLEDGVYGDEYYQTTPTVAMTSTTSYITTSAEEEITEAPTNKCYQCSYSPSKTIYQERAYVKKIRDPKTKKFRIIHAKKLIPIRQVGGWDKCGGTFSQSDAKKHGIDTWDCKYNCFVRVNQAGYLFRGCYRGEFGVDPNNTNDIQEVGDSQYKFCAGGLCNNHDLEHV